MMPCGFKLMSGIVLLLLWAPYAGAKQQPLPKEQMRELLEKLDARQRSVGDYKALIYMEQKEKGKDNLLYEAVTYRRDTEDRFMMLFMRPKSESGKGYLRIDEHLFFYDPTVGRWERRTERERIAGTNSRRTDFDESRLAERFDPSYVALEELGRYTVHHLKLRAKQGADVAYPRVHLWVDTETKNILKRQEYALSGKLVRTSYYPKWGKVYSESKQDHVYFPKQIRVFDEIEEGTQTSVVVRKVDLSELPANIFTKAWLESKSR